jgi:predicted ArsR family transcriptional regulator
MDQPTRKLLAVLGSDAAGAICERLARGPASKTELGEELGLNGREVAGTLGSLLLVGLVGSSKGEAEGPGRRPEVWKLVAEDELVELETYVKKMRHRLIDDEDGG